MAKLDPKDPRNVPGNAPEVSDKDVKLGVYVYQPRNEADEAIGEKKYLASNDQAHVQAFLQVGYRAATEAETKDYVAKTKAAREESRKEVAGVKTESADNSKEVDALKKQLESERQAREEAESKLSKSSAKKEGDK